MNRLIINLVPLLLFLFLTKATFSQGVAITTDGSSADGSAILDVKSTSAPYQGFLLPRLTTAQRDAVASPAEALLIFNTTTKCFESYISGAWYSVSCPSCTAPPVPVANAASNIVCTSFSANWSASAGATTYYLDASTDIGFETFVTGFNNLNVGNVTTYSVTGLNTGTTYYYRLKAANACSNGYSNTITATTSAGPAAPVANAASGITCAAFSANWAASAGATSYRLDVSTDNTFATYLTGFQDLNVGNVVTYNMTGLSGGTNYYYRIRAVNACGAGSNSGTITATTLAGPAAPVANVPYSWTITSTAFQANWDAVAGATKYYLDVSTSNTFASFVTGFNNLDVGNVTSKNISGLTAGVTYYYRVRAYNGSCTSANSNTITVSTNSYDLFNTSGTWNWTCPAGVTSVNVVCIGGGGSGANGDGYGGGGGELRWKNNIPVVPGNTYTVIVGVAGDFASNSTLDINGTDGGFSSFKSGATTIVLANGGKGGTHATFGLGGSGGIGDGGGNGGNGGNSACSGGGGCGGYSGNGGDGGTNGGGASGAGTGGAASGGAGGNLGTNRFCDGGTSRTAGGGGGTGIFGSGASGASVSGYAGDCTSGTGGAGGNNGSGGFNGHKGYVDGAGSGGWFYGGGAGAGSVDNGEGNPKLGGGQGGNGGVLIDY